MRENYGNSWTFTGTFNSLNCKKIWVLTMKIITSEDYGLLCPPKDPECLAEKILMALEMDWDREKIRKYAERFTWDSIVKKVLGVYSEVLDQR